MELTEQQHKAAEEIVNFFQSDSRQMHLLEGYAGTGKTFTMKKVLQLYKSLYPRNKVLLASPTHKALKVLRNSVTDETNFASSFNYKTLHSALGLKEQITKKGEQIFVKDTMAKVVSYDFAIIDECSMIPDDIWEILISSECPFSKILFVGDRAQIPPVRTNGGRFALSKVFAKHNDEYYNMHFSRLTDIVRQKAGNPIIDISKFVREAKSNKLSIDELLETIDPLQGQSISILNSLDSIHNTLKEYFCSSEFDQDPDYAKVLAYTNAMVDGMNAQIRAFKFGADAPDFVLGEKLVAKSPIFEQGEIIINNNEEFYIKSIEPKEVIIAERTIPYLEIVVVLDSGVEWIIPILDSKGKPIFNALLEEIKEDAKTSHDPKSVWSKYYKLKQRFADVGYNYALTAHKAQGSTFKNTFLMLEDLMPSWGEPSEVNRLLYTAITRSSDKLFILY